ncbi:MAG: rcc01693 family protein [Pseudomonadota bacterium]
MSDAPTNWAALMRAGIKGLGLRPHDFWALTPSEFEILLGRPSGVSPLRRTRLDQLLAEFPDQGGDESDG